MNGNYTILILSPHPGDRTDFWESIFRQAGCRVLIIAADPGFQLGEQEEPDLIFADATTLSGEEAVKFSHSVSNTYADKLRSVPLLLLADAAVLPEEGSADEQNIWEEINPGAVLNTPVEPLRLAATAARLIEHSRLTGALKKAEENYGVLAENANDIIFTVDLNAVFTSLNRAAERISGYSREELVGSHFSKVVAPESWELVRQKMREKIVGGAAAGDEVTIYEADILTRDEGRRITLEINSRRIEKDGAPAGILGIARDITYRREAERALRESEERFRLILRATNDALWDWDLRNQSLWWSDSYYLMVGLSPGEITPSFEEWERRIHPEDRERALGTFQAAIDSGENSWSGEYRYRRADNSYAHILDRGYIIFEEGKPARLIGAMMDITERKMVDDNLRVSEANLAAAQRLTHLGSWEIILTDMRRIKNNKVHWSDEVYRIFGYEPGEIEITYDSYFEQMVHPEDRKRVEREFMKAVSRNEKLDVEYRAILPNGVERYHHGLAELFYDKQSGGDDEGVPKLIGTVQDITERRQTEMAIAEANERAIREYQKLLDRIAKLAESLGSARDLLTIYRALYSFAGASVPCTGFFISLYDPKKNVRLPAYAASGSEETDVSELPPMEMSGSPNSRAVSTGSVIIENDFQSAMAGKPVVNIGLNLDPGLPQSCLVVPMSIMGKSVGAVEVQSGEIGAYMPHHAIAMQMAANLVANAIENVRLLEQERQSSEQLRQAQKLESVGRLAGGIAHDFNNMLTAINGYSSLILRKLAKDDPLRQKVEEIKKAGERSAALTQQLLAFSRQQVLKPKVLDINEVVIDTSKLLQRLIGEDIQLSIIPNPMIGRVQVDPVQLTQVIMNLAVNARDAMPQGGSLTIETANVYLDNEYADRHFPTKPGSYVMLAITDTGKGMDKETRDHIFEPFFTTKEVGKGTGLGLSTVYGIVKQSGGYIWVYSERGEGATFKIYLPRVDAGGALQEEGEREEMIDDTPGGNETILLVEDEESVRKMTRQMLETCGYHIIEARNGEEALAICRNAEEKIDLLITDVVMPKMSGRELVEKLAQMNRQLPQLFMSGYTDDAIIRQGMITEEMNFIQKPFSFEELTRKVRELLDA